MVTSVASLYMASSATISSTSVSNVVVVITMSRVWLLHVTDAVLQIVATNNLDPKPGIPDVAGLLLNSLTSITTVGSRKLDWIWSGQYPEACINFCWVGCSLLWLAQGVRMQRQRGCNLCKLGGSLDIVELVNFHSCQLLLCQVLSSKSFKCSFVCTTFSIMSATDYSDVVQCIVYVQNLFKKWMSLFKLVNEILVGISWLRQSGQCFGLPTDQTAMRYHYRTI